MCGGTADTPQQAEIRHGLSPRVRGNQAPDPGRASRGRSIPACAGEPRPGRLSARCRQVYPRVCGGTRRDSWTSARLWGLSPRVRGNLDMRVSRPRQVGSIPACAGEPRRLLVWRHGQRVYPRVCGGTWGAGACRRIRRGLSPRVRGNRHRRSPSGVGPGSIPACAGEPLMADILGNGFRVYPRVCGGTTGPGRTGCSF